MTGAAVNGEAIPDDIVAGEMSDEELCRLLDGSLNVAVDPAATLRAMPDAPLARLADGLFRHLDTPSPVIGARFWFLQVTDELRRRRLAGAGPDDGSPEGSAPEAQPGADPLASEVSAG